VTLITCAAFILVPVLNLERRTVWSSPNFSIPVDTPGFQAFAPFDSAFENGKLVGPNGTTGVLTPSGEVVCAGQVIDATSCPIGVSACQSFNFQLGMGSLYFDHTWGFVLMNGMTLPVILMFLGFPFRL